MNESALEGDDESGDDYPWIEHFEHFCESDSLTLGEARRMTVGISTDDLRNSSFLHRTCMNEGVTRKIVKHFLGLFPQAIDICSDVDMPGAAARSAYPLHLACYNEDCPTSVIKLLLNICGREHPSLKHLCFVENDWSNYSGYIETGGLPLHYYLSRRYKINFEIVKLMVEIYPESLSTCDGESLCLPVQVALQNENVGNMLHIVKFLIESNPASLEAVNSVDDTPLHLACSNSNATVDLIRLILNACPQSASQRDICERLPLHNLCDLDVVSDDAEAENILTLLLEAFPGSTKHRTDENDLPLHLAANKRDPGFCKILVAADPEAVRKVGFADLPFHNACQNGNPDTVKYLFGLYPDALWDTGRGCLPIHDAASWPGVNTTKIIDFLLTHDPDCMTKTASNMAPGDGSLPLHVVCANRPPHGLAELLFDLYPDAILKENSAGKTPIDVLVEENASIPIDEETGLPYNTELRHSTLELISYFHIQTRYARTAQDNRAMTTPDLRGRLPLHIALEDHALLGAIKLLVRGNANAFGVANFKGELPLNMACRSCAVDIVKFFAQFYAGCLNTFDSRNDSPLHHACRGGNFDMVKYLLERPMSSVSERNVDDMLPIHLFCDFAREQWQEESSIQCVETIWCLLLAYPEVVVNG